MMWSFLITMIYLLLLFWIAKKDILWGISMLLFLVPIFLIRLQIFGIPTTALELGIYLVFGLFLWKMYRTEIIFKWHNIYYLVVVWLLIALISSLVISDDKISSLGLWKGWFFDPILVFVMAANALYRKVHYRLIYLGFVFLIALLVVVACVQFVFDSAITVDGRISAFYQSANYLAMILVPCLLYTLSKYLFEKKILYWELLLWFAGVVVLIMTASYVGIFSLLLGVLFLAWMVYTKSVKSFLWVVLGSIVLFCLFLMTQSGTERLSHLRDLSARSSLTVRLEVWETALGMIKENKWWGIGLGNFEEKYIEYAPRYFHPPMEWKMLHAHNLYMHTWLELTIFGLVALLLLLLWWWICNLRVLKNSGGYWVYGILAIILSYVLGGMFDTPYYKNDLSLVFWLLLGITMASVFGQKNKLIKK